MFEWKFTYPDNQWMEDMTSNMLKREDVYKLVLLKILVVYGDDQDYRNEEGS